MNDSKIRLTIYTNIPTPNQLDFFEALAIKFDLKVIYYAPKESNRQWVLDYDKPQTYSTYILQDSFLARLIAKRYYFFHFSWKIFRHVLFDTADMIITSGAYNSPNTLIAAVFSKWRKKTIAFWGEKLITSSHSFFLFKVIFLIPLSWSCDFFLCIGKEAIKSYEYYGIRKIKYNLAYNINTNSFSRNELNEHKIQQLASIYRANQEIILLSSGALINRKAMDTAIKVAKKLLPNYNIKLLILGDGVEKEYLQKIIGNDDRIQLLGFKSKEEIPYYFAIADIFLFTTRYDGWGLVINEAIAAGLPIVATRTCGAAVELIEEGVNGYLCDVDNIEDISTKLEWLIQNEVLRHTMRKNMEAVCVKTSSTACAQQLHEIALDNLKRKQTS